MSFTDKNLTCKDCGKEFTFTAGEQEFYQQKGFQNEPIKGIHSCSPREMASRSSSILAVNS